MIKFIQRKRHKQLVSEIKKRRKIIIFKIWRKENDKRLRMKANMKRIKIIKMKREIREAIDQLREHKNIELEKKAKIEQADNHYYTSLTSKGYYSWYGMYAQMYDKVQKIKIFKQQVIRKRLLQKCFKFWLQTAAPRIQKLHASRKIFHLQQYHAKKQSIKLWNDAILHLDKINKRITLATEKIQNLVFFVLAIFNLNFRERKMG
jgi:hypothetical protein